MGASTELDQLEDQRPVPSRSSAPGVSSGPRGFRSLSDGLARFWRAVRRVRISGSLALGAFLVLLAVASTRGEWVTFPVRASLRAGDVFLAATRGPVPLSMGGLLQRLVLAGVVCAALSRWGSVVFFAGASALVLSLPLQVAFYRVSWLAGYIEESGVRLLFSAYATEHFVDNQSPEPAFTPVTQFQDAAEQMYLGFTMMGWGWYIASAATLGLLAIVLNGLRFGYRLPTAIGLVGGLSALLAGPPLLGLLSAERELVRGDRFLVDGRASNAIEAYESALERNPALALSRPFLVKASMALNVATQGRHPLGLLGADFGLEEAKSDDDLTARYASARQHLAARRTLETYRVTGLDQPLAQAADRLESDLWLLEGIAFEKEHHYARALGAFTRALPRSAPLYDFFLAHAYMALESGPHAVDLLRRIEPQIGQKSLHADILCTLGDAYTLSGDPLSARVQYLQCRLLDKMNNFRATKALTGS